MRKERRFGLLGRKLGHSFSPEIHAALSDYEYALYEVEPGDLAGFLKGCPLSGFNVTIPYKEAVLPYLADMSPAARAIGSVNTVVRRPDGTLVGDNTDAYGFSYLLASAGIDPAGQKAVVFGSGGSSKTVSAVLRERGAEKITVVSRRGEHTYENLHLVRDAQILVNTTPVGMYPHTGASPADIGLFDACAGVVDLIYNPARTKLLLDAKRRGIPCANGLKMLVAQAKRAAEIFTGQSIAQARVDEIAANIARQTQNIVLVGMPGCGKSTIGKEIARLTGRRFLDADKEIALRAGVSIPEYFEQHGEEGFRRLETEVLREICRESGCVIAAGGGAVTRAENLDIIRQNGTPVYITRPLADLATEGRPLSGRHGVEALYAARRGLYEAFAEHTFANRGVEETAKQIVRGLLL